MRRGQAQDEAEQVGALGVEPLGVVEDEQDGAGGGEAAEHFDDGQAQGYVVAAGAGGVGLAAEQGDGGALGSGEAVEGGAGDGGEEGRGGGLGYLPVAGFGGEAQDGFAPPGGGGRDGPCHLGLSRPGAAREDGAAVRGQRAVDRLDECTVSDVGVSVPRRRHAQPPAFRAPAPVPFL